MRLALMDPGAVKTTLPTAFDDPRSGTCLTCAQSSTGTDLPYADIFRVRDGKVYYHAVYFDQMTMMMQLGLMPQPTAAGA
jgi:hypothetical protein